MPFEPSGSPPPGVDKNMTAEERDQRTIFILQIARTTRPRDMEEFFSSVGSVRDVRIITDSRTRRSKGIGYVEFWEEDSVPLALALNGQKLLGAPLVIQRTCAERNRAAAASATIGGALGFGANNKGPVKLCVSQLHPLVDDTMLSGIFDPFGRIEEMNMETDAHGQRTGTAFITFKYAEDATKAIEQLNGFEVAGTSMKVVACEGPSSDQAAPVSMPGLGHPSQANYGQQPDMGYNSMPQEELGPDVPNIATHCFMLTNMFDPTKESQHGWEHEVRDDVIEECSRWGGAVHVYVDKGSHEGNVYVKCNSISVSHKCVQALHGRFFSGKVITANYVPLQSYHDLFPDSARMTSVLVPSTGY